MASSFYAQDESFLTSFNKREEMRQVIRLENGRYLLSGRTFELQNKSDLVILLDSEGKEIIRKPICDECLSGEIVFSKETDNGELFHVRSTGDIFVSSLDLSDTRFVYNLKQGEYESIDTYQVIENARHVVIVSAAVKNGVKGLLHSTINTFTEALVSQKFNTFFPDIAGSIGIGLFNDAGVVDGYNVLENGNSKANLLRYDHRRDLLWEQVLDWGDIKLNGVLVAYNQSVYAVGTIRDENDSDHQQGLIVSYDGQGNLLWEKRFDSQFKGEHPAANFTFQRIEQLNFNRFVVIGHDGKTENGKDKADAVVIQIDRFGEQIDYASSQELTEFAQAVDVTTNGTNEDLIYLSNSISSNGISGSYLRM